MLSIDDWFKIHFRHDDSQCSLDTSKYGKLRQNQKEIVQVFLNSTAA